MRLALALIMAAAGNVGAGGSPPSPPSGLVQERYDVLVRGGRLLDGSGNPWRYADVGIRAGRIVAVGRLASATALRTIDARGKYVAPGFIDIHSHADDGASADGGFRDRDPKRRAALNLVSQGITTVVVNQDGRSPLPIREQRLLLEQNGIGPNAALMVATAASGWR